MNDLHVPSSIRREIGLPPGLITVRFAAPDPLDSPGGYRYEIPPEDRKILEQAISDSKSPDAVRQAAAREGLLSGLRVGGGFFTQALAAGVETVMNLLGFGVLADIRDTSDPDKVFEIPNYFTAPEEFQPGNISIITAMSWEYSGGVATVEMSGIRTGLKWIKHNGFWDAGDAASNIGVVGENFTAFLATMDQEIRVGDSGSDESTPPSGVDPGFGGSAQYEGLSASRCYRFRGRNDEKEDYRFLSDCLPMDGSAFDFEHPLDGLEGMEPIGDLDPALSDVEPDELQDIIDELKNPDGPYAPYIGKPESDPGDVRLPVPGSEDLTNPDLGTPLDNLKLDRDMGLGDLARFDMPLPEDAFGPDTGVPKKGLRPGDPLNVGIGPDDGFGGKIGKFEPMDPGLGDFTGTAPPFADENFTKPRCYKNRPITSIVRDLAVELGLNPDTTFVEPGCDKRFTGCFKKGSSKFDAMWDLADRCGYGVFPDPGDGGKIAPVTPLRVHHGPYHEDVDLFVFDPVYDDFEVYSHVEVTRPAYRNRPGYSVVLPVNSIYSVPDDKWETRVVGPSVTEPDAMDMAARRVRELRRRTLRIEVAVPYRPGMRPRHQAIVSRPTRRFRQNYMITGVRHDLSTEGWLTVWTGVYLDAEESRRYR